MALRANWEGYLKLSLISVPIKGYTATAPGRGKVHFHQLHAKCHSRIRYQKVCPIHGEVTKDEIVSGFEYAKGEYVVVDPEEIKKLLPENERAVTIESFVPIGAVDSLYYNGRTYYLVPDGAAGSRPYAVLHRVMADQGRGALGRAVIAGREHVVLVRPLGRLLAMELLSYESEIKKPQPFEEEVPEVKLSAEELKLAQTLVEATATDEVDLSRYKDEYTERLAKIIEAKAAGRKIAAPRKGREPVIINLMDALRKSLNETKGARKKAGNSRKSRKHAPAGARNGTAHPRRKTG